jgi:hypothetical protein
MTEKIPTVKLGYLRNTVQDELSRNHSEKAVLTIRLDVFRPKLRCP